MNVVLAHKFFRMTGGTEKYFQDLAMILEKNGHHTIPFALEHPDNRPTPYAKYFLSDLDYQQTSLWYRLQKSGRILGRTLYSWEAKRKMSQLIRDTRPDIAHIQSIEHHISPSILHALAKNNIPIIQSVNTYKLVCASYRFYLFDRAETCQRCLYHKHYHAVQTRCVKGSLPASFLAMIEMYLHAAMKIYHLVDRFIVPNQFIAKHLVGAGFAKEKIVKLLNPLQLQEYTPSYDFDNYILYFGRIDPEKGVMTLVEAMAQLPKLRLIIVGNGSQFDEVQATVQQQQLHNVELVGPKWGDAMLAYLAKARAVVVPSLWFEPSPYVVYQSLAMGKPVIGSNVGGIPDLLTPETGRLFIAGDVSDLVRQIRSIAFDKTRLQQMGHAARKWAEDNFDPERYYGQIITMYQQLIDAKN